MDSLLYQDTITVWHDLGEVNRRRTFKRSVYDRVHVEEQSSTIATMLGSTSLDGLMIYALPREGMSLKEGDQVMRGVVDSEKPPAKAQKIVAVREQYFMGKLDHIELAVGRGSLSGY